MITVLFIKLCVCVKILTVIEYRKRFGLSSTDVIEFSKCSTMSCTFLDYNLNLCLNPYLGEHGLSRTKILFWTCNTHTHKQIH